MPDIPQNDDESNWDLETARKAIWRVDFQIIQLLALRLNIGQAVAEIKRIEGLSILDPEQEKKVISRWRNNSKDSGIPFEVEDDIIQVAKTIMEATKKIQRMHFENNSVSLAGANYR